MSDILEKEVSESGVLTLRMNRPDVLNSLNSDIVFALIDAFNNAAEDDNVRAIVLTGNGRGFCAGADLAGGNWPSEKGMTPGDITANSMEIGFNPLVRAVVDSPKPVITAINGVAAGGGVGLALSGDLVLAAESAKFRLVFAPQLGIIPDVGASWLVPNLVGRARANGLALLGDDLSAEKAQEWGMVWEVHPDDQLVAKAQEYAARMAQGSITGIKATVRAHDKAMLQSIHDQLDFEKEEQRHYTNQPVFFEGVRAFIEKRKPNFREIEAEQMKTARDKK
ncbi:enoyl-CoA hydratase-related protein [Alphaproteobacteria bacterium]|jgi:2-(1,2-epoxy-1,2-dihydrophenyl)acetyl-CoA isomerase|nr:enoyl-CoA hydratase-related protein [Alphaproteobacteria bacterium]MDA8666984.1 enoyl-CoA hydratase-related protein [Alphaproteobacteria bacterium]MDA8776557.1 enoyl-CoA hydratase-related protein [Alphaproteobacteria bacterium]MDA9590910.1 enoyl-CoA hydratase-related protein [Alphaproteobacteria bacterium]MDB2405849.1 enoyl-CoA hydratase-related protein [Alphaproteobacteria bacterium]